MVRQSIAEFRKLVTGDTGPEVERPLAMRTREEEKQHDAETCSVGVALLLSVAKLAQHFHDFPDHVPLTHRTADGKGIYGLTRDKGGIWHITGDHDAFFEATRKNQISTHPRWLRAAALLSMDVPHTIVSDDYVASYLTWGRFERLGGMITSVSGSVPRHTVYSILGHGTTLAPYFEAAPDAKFALTLIDTVSSLGFDLDGSSTPSTFPALLRQVMRADDVFVREMVARGATADLHWHGSDAATLAAEKGTVSTLSSICDRKDDINAVNVYGENLLHTVLHRLNAEDNWKVPPMVEYLLSKGIDVTPQNQWGHTPAQTVEHAEYAATHVNKNPRLLEAIGKTKELLAAVPAPSVPA